jgi:hypothetical protein
MELYLPPTHDSSRHHADRVERGDEIGSGGGEVEGQDHRQLEKHGIVDLDGGKDEEEEAVEVRERRR